VIPDLIAGRPNAWTTLYDPRRKTLRATGEFAKENLNVAAQYLEWATPGEVQSEEEIAAGSGAVMRRGLKKIAVYRDLSGALYRYSAACPHLGCVVGWNPTESSWDCPCHGSRFDARGAVLNGPATIGLPRVED
jgi:Rieske Fe-S protein